MKADNREAIKSKLAELKELRQDIYDYDYDWTALWHLDRAIENLQRAIN